MYTNLQYTTEVHIYINASQLIYVIKTVLVTTYVYMYMTINIKYIFENRKLTLEILAK